MKAATASDGTSHRLPVGPQRVTKMTHGHSRFYEKYGRQVTLLGCLLLPFFVWTALKAVATNSNEVKDWLPADYPETAEFEWFRKHFPNDEFIAVTWEGCTLEDPRLDRFAEIVQRPPMNSLPDGGQRFPRVVTGRSSLNEMLDAFRDISRDEAVLKLRGSLVGPDLQQTCAIVSLSDEGRRDVHGSLAVIHAATAEAGVSESDLKLGGTPVVNASIDRVSASSLTRVTLLCTVVVTIIAWTLIHNLRVMVLILVTGLYAAAISLAVLWLTGTSMNALLITMIPLVYVAATSGAIHVSNYYMESVREGGVVGAADRAISHAWLPLALATATTTAGLVSVCYTDLVLIRTFGIYSAIGVALSWLVLVLWLPSALAAWRPYHADQFEPTEPESETGEAPLPPFWQWLGSVISLKPVGFAVVCLAIWLGSMPGLWNVIVSIDFLKEFKPQSELVQTYVWLENRLGPLMPLEVVVRFDDDSPLTMQQRLRLSERLQKRFESLEDTGGTISPATFIPEAENSSTSWLQRGFRNRRIEAERERVIRNGYIAESKGEELWRISVRVVGLREINYAHLVDQLRHEFKEELASNPEIYGEGVSASYTGVAPVLFKARQSMVDGLFWGVVTDLLLIMVTIGVLMRHWSSGILMMLVSLFPTFVVLGFVGWAKIEIDIGAIMAPCVALGVTVDDVVHFLLWFRTGVQRGMSQRDAVLLAYRASVRPMYQSCALLGMGMGCLIISEFVPILQFGMIMVAMLVVGLVGNLIFLPALLAGPLGRVIALQSRRRQARQSQLPAANAAKTLTSA